MALKDTYFYVLDNTGAQLVKCIHIFKSRTVKPASLMIVVIKKCLVQRKIKKGLVVRAVSVRLAKPILQYTGNISFYVQNAVVLLKKNEYVPSGTRIFGSIFYELRKSGFMKIISLAAFMVQYNE